MNELTVKGQNPVERATTRGDTVETVSYHALIRSFTARR